MTSQLKLVVQIGQKYSFYFDKFTFIIYHGTFGIRSCNEVLKQSCVMGNSKIATVRKIETVDSIICLSSRIKKTSI